MLAGYWGPSHTPTKRQESGIYELNRAPAWKTNWFSSFSKRNQTKVRTSTSPVSIQSCIDLRLSSSTAGSFPWYPRSISSTTGSCKGHICTFLKEREALIGFPRVFRSAKHETAHTPFPFGSQRCKLPQKPIDILCSVRCVTRPTAITFSTSGGLVNLQIQLFSITITPKRYLLKLTCSEPLNRVVLVSQWRLRWRLWKQHTSFLRL